MWVEPRNSIQIDKKISKSVEFPMSRMCACVSKLAKALLKFVLFTVSMAQYHKADSLIDRRSKYICHILHIALCTLLWRHAL